MLVSAGRNGWLGNLGLVKAGAALVLTADPSEAGRRAVTEARASLGGLTPSFAVLFASADFAGSAEALVAAVADEIGPLPLIGCVAQAVVGGRGGHSPDDLRPVHVPPG